MHKKKSLFLALLFMFPTAQNPFQCVTRGSEPGSLGFQQGGCTSLLGEKIHMIFHWLVPHVVIYTSSKLL